MDIVSGLQRAIDYIEAHLGEADLPRRAAAQAHLSPLYFSRLFAHLCGLTPAEYIRLRRLSCAGADLAAGARVLDTALRYGYESPESFARAFSRFAGFPPSEAKKPGAALTSFSRLVVRISLQGGTTMHYTITHKNAFFVLQKAERHTTRDAHNRQSIPAFWTRAAADGTLGHLQAVSGGTLFGICWGDEDADGGFPYAIGAACPADAPVPDGFARREIPAGEWAVFPCRGAAPDAIQALWGRILSEFFPTVAYRPTGALDIEVYPAGDMTAPDYAAEIWVPVERIPDAG